MTMPAPTLEINTGYGWYDASAFVVMGAGITMKRGRSSQFDSSSPGTCSFTLDNSDGDFTVPNALGITIQSEVRVTVSAYQVWYGYIDSMSTTIGPGYGQTISVNCTDDFKLYAKSKLSAYGIEQSHQLIGAYSAGATYSLEAPRNGVGSFWKAFRDTAASPIRIYGGSAGSHEFASNGPAFATPCINLLPNANSIGPVLEHPTSFNPGTENAVVSFWFKTENLEPGDDIYLIDMRRTSGGSGHFSIVLDAAQGKLKFTGAGDSTGVINHTSTADKLWDQQWHHVAVKVTHPTNTQLAINIDGVLDSSHTATNLCSIASTNRRIVFGGFRNSAWTDNSYVLNGSLAIIGVYKYTGSPALTTIYGACTDGDVGDSITTRLASLADFVNVTNPTVADASGRTLSGQDTDNKSFLEAVQDIEVTERGVFYITRLGAPAFRGSAARDAAASVVLTLDAAKDITGDFTVSIDDALFANVVVASGPIGSYVAVDSGSVAAVGEVIDSFSSLAGTEAYLTDTADERLADRVYSDTRLSKITVDLLTTPNAIAATTVRLIPIDRVSVTGLDSIFTGASTFDGFVEGWELSISDNSYTCTLDLSPVI
jgi:hypothetical protein